MRSLNGWLFIRAICLISHFVNSVAILDVLSNRLSRYEIIRIERRIEKRGISTSSLNAYNRQERVSFSAFNRRFELYLTPKKGVVHSNFICREIDANGLERFHNIDPEEHFEGHVQGSKDSVISLTIDEYGSLLGIINVDNETYVFEPARIHSSKSDAADTLAYRTSDMKLDYAVSGAEFCSPVQLADQGRLAVEKSKRIKRSDDQIIRNRCTLRVVADYLFFQTIGNGSIAFSSRYLINVVDRVNALYTSTDWGTDSYGRKLVNLGFMIKDMVIHSAPTLSPSTHYNYYNDTKPSVNTVLDSFSREQGSESYCLVHLFTAQSFENGVLGLGYIASPELSSVGGICSAVSHTLMGDVYYNTALSSAKTTQGGTVITREADIVTAHELGHNWGAMHDDSSSECSPSYGQGGSYVMNTYSVSGYDYNNNRFSPCSRRLIGKVLSKKIDECFEEEKKSFCGNGRVENITGDEFAEQCDEGGLLSGTNDSCCTSDCRLQPGAMCSPKNVPCCSSSCQFLPSTRLCLHENSLQCKRSSYCTGISGECPEPMAVEDGTPCIEDGECHNGHCLAFCERPSINKKPCICPNEADSCLRCCRSANGSCEPFGRDPKYILKDGTRCIHGYCQNAVCIREVADVVSHLWNIIESIDETNFWKFVQDNVVGLTVIMTLLMWIPISIFVHHTDKAHVAKLKLEEEKLADVEIVHGEKSVYDYMRYLNPRQY